MKNYLLILSLAICTIANAQYTKLLDFADSANGSFPTGSLISDGTFLYGMTSQGGTDGLGTVFKIKPDGTGFVKLLDFSGPATGRGPLGSLLSDGTFLYGMTGTGGTNSMGVIFKMKPDGTGFVKLLDFAGTANGRSCYGSLISDGTFLYGMTFKGGTNDLGTVFKIKPDGTGYAKLLDFAGAANGRNPSGSLISDGTFLYGMTLYGGTNNLGVIFKIKPDGSSFAKLLDFPGFTDGSHPYGSLISDGTFLYGMTYGGGAYGPGVVFKIKPDGTGYVNLHDFEGGSNGSHPWGSLISDGTYLYGMTSGGGTNNDGVVFKIKPDGTGYVKLIDFVGATNGSHPYYGPLFFNGTFLYGMTYTGGTNDLGVVFKYQLCTPSAGTDIITACNSYTWIDGNTYTSSNSTAMDTITGGAANGCDSLVTLNLTIKTVDTTVIQNSNVLTATASNATYQWLDCNSGFSIITGATNQSYTATANGNYAVIVTQNNCSDTSSCYKVSTIGINSNALYNGGNIYPNPFSSTTVLQADHFLHSATLIIVNCFGQTVMEISNISGQTLVLSRDNLASGLYFIRLVEDNQIIATKKIIITD